MSTYGGTLTPAYGRDYTSKKAALADWNDGKDFMLHDVHQSTYCSRRDFDGKGIAFQIRWKRMTEVGIIEYSDRKKEWR